MKRYEKYKVSGVEWIGKIPEHWTISKFKYFARIKNGKDQKSVITENGKYPILGTGGEFGRSNEYLHNKPSVLLGRKGTIDKPQFIKEPFWTVDTLFYTEIYDNTIPEYLFYLSQLIPFQLLQESSAVPSMTQDKLNNVILCRPSIEDQRIILNYLDYKTGLIDNIIAQKEQIIKKLKEQRQAIINEAVTKGLNPNTPLKDSGMESLGEIPEHWNTVKFRFKFETTKGLTITKSDLQDEGIPCVNYGEIHSKYGFEVNPEIHNLKCVSEDYMETNKGSLLSKGDFVFADTSEDIEGSGNFTHLNSEVPTFAGYHTIIARLIDNSNYRYFAYFFDSSTYRTQIQNLVKGVKVFSITNKILKDTVLLCPPVEEQQTIAEYIDNKTVKIFSAIQQTEQSIQKLKEYRQSIISEAVTGKIDVREWQIPNNN